MRRLVITLAALTAGLLLPAATAHAEAGVGQSAATVQSAPADDGWPWFFGGGDDDEEQGWENWDKDVVDLDFDDIL
ncbi:hypothetical protein [Spirillospora sp. NPDC029432]|uniref:hypothetical protein n=1 Tax=Spirillospora sp. NPDC029432 TaxID=3154599 RepID=UPI0034515311